MPLLATLYNLHTSVHTVVGDADHVGKAASARVPTNGSWVSVGYRPAPSPEEEAALVQGDVICIRRDTRSGEPDRCGSIHEFCTGSGHVLACINGRP